MSESTSSLHSNFTLEEDKSTIIFLFVLHSVTHSLSSTKSPSLHSFIQILTSVCET